MRTFTLALALALLAPSVAVAGTRPSTVRPSSVRPSSVSPSSVSPSSVRPSTVRPSSVRPSSAAPVVVAAPGRWRQPVAGSLRVLRPFSLGATVYAAGNRGVDLAAAQGSAVVSPAAGRVVYAGLLAGVGVVSVDHGSGVKSTYQPVRAVVHVGDRVAAGQLLGTIDGTRPACRASCLHWGALRSGVYVDPLTFLRPPRVRLLPDR